MQDGGRVWWVELGAEGREGGLHEDQGGDPTRVGRGRLKPLEA